MGYVLHIIGRVGASSASWWWLRSANNNNNFNCVSSSGSNNNNNANNAYGVALGSSLVRQSNRKAKSVRGGEKEHMTLPERGKYTP